jgi:hypothetical protein
MTLDFCLKFIFKNRHAGVIPAGRQAMPHKTVNNDAAQLFLSATLAQTFNTRCSALAGAAITY